MEIDYIKIENMHMTYHMHDAFIFISIDILLLL